MVCLIAAIAAVAADSDTFLAGLRAFGGLIQFVKRVEPALKAGPKEVAVDEREVVLSLLRHCATTYHANLTY